MTTPNFLASYFRYLSVSGIMDVADIITHFRAEVVTNPPLANPPGPAWVESPADTFQSPVDADGRSFYIVLSRASATILSVIIKNQSLVTIFNGRINIDGGGTEVRFYTGPMHAWIDSVRGTPESCAGGLLDLSPRPQTYHSNYTFGFAYRDNNGNITAPNSDTFATLDNGSPVLNARAINEAAAGYGAAPLLDASGFTIHRPLSLLANMSGVNRRIGRLFHTYMVDASIADGAELQIPINDSPLTNGTFKVIGRAPSTGFKAAVRKG